MIICKINTLIISLLFVVQVFAANYYVDFTGGVDTNNGTSDSTPFKHCPGDNNATNTASSTTLSAGDTIFFEGGVSYDGQIDIDWSGSIGSYIVYDGNSKGDWGTGKAIIDQQNTTSYTVGFNASGSRSYIRINNFELTEIGGYTDAELSAFGAGDCPIAARNGIGIEFYDYSCNNIIIENCYLHEIGEWANEVYVDANSLSGVGITFQSSSNIIIDNCEITKVRTGIALKASTGTGGTIRNVEIKNCNIHDYLTWCIDISPRSENCTIDSIFIHDNEIHNYYQYDNANWASGCGANPHTDGIFYRCDYDNTTYGIAKFYNNSFYSNYTSGGGTGCIYIAEAGGQIYIYNNQFKGTLHNRNVYVGRGERTGSTYQQVYVYNNSFYLAATAISLAGHISSSLGTMRIYNNSFFAQRGDGTILCFYIENNYVDADSIFFDYNQYYTDNTNDYVGRWDNRASNAGWKTFAEIVSEWSFETNGALGNPRYVDVSYGIGNNSNSNDLHLASDAPGIDAALDLSATFTTDFDDITRISWDIGAFEYDTTAAPIISQKILNVLSVTR